MCIRDSNFSALQTYLICGEEFIRRTTLKNDEILTLRSDELLDRVRDLMNKQHEVLYYLSLIHIWPHFAACAR